VTNIHVFARVPGILASRLNPSSHLHPLRARHSRESVAWVLQRRPTISTF